MLLFSLPRRVKNQLEVWGTQKVKCIATHLPGLHELHSCRRFIWYLSIELHGFFNTQNGAFIWGMKTASSESDHYHVVIVHVTIISVHMSPGIQNTAINGHLSIVLAALVFYPNSFPSGWGVVHPAEAAALAQPAFECRSVCVRVRAWVCTVWGGCPVTPQSLSSSRCTSQAQSRRRAVDWPSQCCASGLSAWPS